MSNVSPPHTNMLGFPEVLQKLPSLSEDERLEARDRARELVIRQHGEKPNRAHFANHAISDYPAWFTKAVSVFLLVVFMAAGAISIFRVFTAGRDHFLESINDPVQAAIVGLATFILAEFLVITSAVTMQVYFRGRERVLMVVPVALGLGMAFVGNWVVTQPDSFWGWLETLTPPLAVLFVALIGEKVVIDAIRRRHKNEVAYQEAVNAWIVATADPESSPRWRTTYANALKAKIKEVNSGKGKAAKMKMMSQLARQDWRLLVNREFAADSWFDQGDQGDQGDQESPAVPLSVVPGSSSEISLGSSNGTNHQKLGDLVSIPTMPNGSGHIAHD